MVRESVYITRLQGRGHTGAVRCVGRRSSCKLNISMIGCIMHSEYADKLMVYGTIAFIIILGVAIVISYIP